jgi:hypothetical protein
VPEYFSLRVRGAARPERLAYCRLRLTASVLAHRLQTPEMDEEQLRRFAVLLLDVGVGKTPGDRLRAVLDPR